MWLSLRRGAARAGGAAQLCLAAAAAAARARRGPGAERGPPARGPSPPRRPPPLAVASAGRCPLARAPGPGGLRSREVGGRTRLARGAQRTGAARLHTRPPPPPRRLQNPEVNSRRPGRFARRSAPSSSRAPLPEPGAPSPALLGPPGSGLRPHPGAPPALPGPCGPGARGGAGPPAGKLRRVAGRGPGRCERCQRGATALRGPGGRRCLGPGPGRPRWRLRARGRQRLPRRVWG